MDYCHLCAQKALDELLSEMDELPKPFLQTAKTIGRKVTWARVLWWIGLPVRAWATAVYVIIVGLFAPGKWDEIKKDVKEVWRRP